MQTWSKALGMFPMVSRSFGKVLCQQVCNFLWNLPAEKQRALPLMTEAVTFSPISGTHIFSDEGCHKETPRVCSLYTPSLRLLHQQEYESSPEESCQWGMISLWLLPGWEIMPCFFANCLICRAERIGLMSNWYIPLQTADPTTEWDANLIIPHVGNRNGISLLNLFSYVGKIQKKKKKKKRCWSGLCEQNTFHSPGPKRNELCSWCRSFTGWIFFFFFSSSIFSITMSCWNFFFICMHVCDSFRGSVWGPFCFPLEVVSWDENQASWTSDKGTSRSEQRQTVLLHLDLFHLA